MLILKRKYFAAKHVNIAIEIEVVGCKKFSNKKCPNWCFLGLCARFEHSRFSQVSVCLAICGFGRFFNGSKNGSKFLHNISTDINHGESGHWSECIWRTEVLGLSITTTSAAWVGVDLKVKCIINQHGFYWHHIKINTVGRTCLKLEPFSAPMKTYNKTSSWLTCFII